MILTAMLVIHVVVCLFIIGVVLLQAPQQANIGSMFGGGASQTVFGSGTLPALVKATAVAAIVFFSTCLLISFVVERQRSLIKREEAVFQRQIKEQTAPKEAPATPGGVDNPAGIPPPTQEAPALEQ